MMQSRWVGGFTMKIDGNRKQDRATELADTDDRIGELTADLDPETYEVAERWAQDAEGQGLETIA